MAKAAPRITKSENDLLGKPAAGTPAMRTPPRRSGASHASERAHRQAISLPNRPVGFAIRMMVMNRYISPSVNNGKPMEPKLRISPIEQRGDQRAGDRAHAADDRDDERLDQDRKPHARTSASEPARQAHRRIRPAAAEREHQPIDQRGIDAERRDHVGFTAAARMILPIRVLVISSQSAAPIDNGHADQKQIEHRHHAAGDKQRRHLERRRHAHRA